MIHILLFILKIIGLILLGLVGLILILLLLVLLSPFRCTLEAKIENGLGSADGKLRFHWLFHLISGEAAWLDGELTWRFRAAWKKFSSEDEPETGAHRSAGRPQEKTATDKKTKSGIPDNSASAKTSRADENESKPEIKGTPEDSKVPGNGKGAVDNTAGSLHKYQSESTTRGENPRTGSAIELIIKKIKNTFNRIKYTFHRLCDKIKSLNNKKERISRFLSNDVHQRAFTRLIRETKKLLKRLAPNRASVNITFGFEDPSYTGYTLAGISLIYPVIGNYTSLTPDFDNKVLKGDVFVKEKIRLIYAVIFIWNMLIDRNVRMTYRHLRKFKW